MSGLDIDFLRPQSTGGRATVVIGMMIVVAGIGIATLSAPAPVTEVRVVEPRPRVAPHPAELPESVRRLLAAPWAGLLDLLETNAASTSGVVLQGLRPDPDDEHLSIEGVADNGSALSDYLGTLERNGLPELRVTHQQSVDAPASAIRFSAAGRWPGADYGEGKARFASELLPASSVSALGTQWMDQAKEVGLTLQSIDHAWTDISPGVAAATLSFDCSGHYRQMREFLNLALANQPAVGLRHFNAQIVESPANAAAGVATSMRFHIELAIYVGRAAS